MASSRSSSSHSTHCIIFSGSAGGGYTSSLTSCLLQLQYAVDTWTRAWKKRWHWLWLTNETIRRESLWLRTQLSVPQATPAPIPKAALINSYQEEDHFMGVSWLNKDEVTQIELPTSCTLFIFVFTAPICFAHECGHPQEAISFIDVQRTTRHFDSWCTHLCLNFGYTEPVETEENNTTAGVWTHHIKFNTYRP